MAYQLRDAKYFFAVLSARMLYAPRPSYVFSEFATEVTEYQKGAGDTVYMNRYPYQGDIGLTLAARAVPEATIIGTSSPVSITPDQVGLVLTSYYGPHNGTNVVSYGVTEEVLERAAVKLMDNMNFESFTNSIGGMWLEDDHSRWHDRVLSALYLQAATTRNPAGKLDAATLNTDKVTTADIIACLRTLRLAEVPTFPNGNYVAVITPQVESNLLEDADFKTVASRSDASRIYNAQIGQYLGIDFVRSSNIPTTVVNSLTASQYVVFGDQAVGCITAKPPQIRKNTNDDYQRLFNFIWRTVKAYAVLNNAFIVKGRSFAV